MSWLPVDTWERHAQAVESRGCFRIETMFFDPALCSSDAVIGKIRDLRDNGIISTMCYCGVTADPYRRMHAIREESVPLASHWPQRWATMTLIALGPLQPLLRLEGLVVREFAQYMTNNLSFCGTGTSQPLLWLYICHNAGLKCICSGCKRGSLLSFGYELSDEESIDEVANVDAARESGDERAAKRPKSGSRFWMSRPAPMASDSASDSAASGCRPLLEQRPARTSDSQLPPTLVDEETQLLVDEDGWLRESAASSAAVCLTEDVNPEKSASAASVGKRLDEELACEDPCLQMESQAWPDDFLMAGLEARCSE